ncbi:hypothetical protein P8452_21577 [Trifolium repens]|nr:hypothetical protein P8452_21577 [Trifolium repens]
MYRSLNNPQGLQGWNGGDPCEESSIGEACSGFCNYTYSIDSISKIQGMSLTRSLEVALYNLQNLKIFDVSSNNIIVKYHMAYLPMAHILLYEKNMSCCNYLSHNIPHSLLHMKRLRHL